MKKLLLIFTILIFGSKLISQKINIPTKFPTDYGVFTFSIGSKVTLELKELKEGKYQYRVLNIEPYEEYYSLEKSKKLFSENPKDNTVEIFFMGAYYNDGKEDKDWKTLLHLRNNLKTPLDYKANIKYYFKDEFENTSINGAFPNASSNEIWAHKIDYITLYDFELLKY
ncbi:hypothetical protein [Chryseobacterium phocaeense]|uniref:hypothetical protein n=1 Tax=Chryseobacterium phocaeense TaxID=1816690 RepID=UPI0009B94A98|nr:hypothetical protein [Chryseobacterium phocaeense]